MLRSIAGTVSILVTILSLTGSAWAVCPMGDLNGDCAVGFEDVQIMAEQWLGPPGSLADLDGLYGVEARDLALLAKQWQASGIPLVINEFIAFNTETGYDPQYEPDDWIELHNFGDEVIDIAGMYLTDDLDVPTKWRAPFGRPDLTTIQGGGYLLIWADGEVWDSGLHACFELDGHGDEIGLYDSDGNTPIDTVAFNDQTPDISFGRYPDASDDWRFMILASPRSTNQLAYLGSVSEVEFSHADKLCDASFYVTLATETPGAVIYYTTDGSEPYVISGRTITGTVYTGPVLISRSVCLRAKAVKMGWKSSTPQTRAYVFLGSDVRGFSSNLPVAVIDTLGAGIGELTPTAGIAAFVDAGHDGRTRLIAYPPDFVGWAGIDIRGKSSAGFDKKQYHFETWDELGRDKDVSILKFPSESDWVLQGPFSDKSLMRNFLAYRWSNDMGRYAVRTRFIEMFLNTGGGSVSMSDYLGVYVFMEKIKLDNNRVDIIELEPADSSEPSITGGYIVKKDKFDSGERTFTTLTGQTLIYVEPEGPDLTPWQAAWIQNYLKEFEQVLYGVKYADPVMGYARYIDVRSFLDEHILVELTKNIDGFRLSTYMHKDRGGKLNMGPPWDYDLSLGNANYLDGWQPVGWYHDLLGDGDYPWWRRLFEDKEFRLKYADRWFGLRKDVLATHQLLADIDDTAALLNEAQVRNFDRWRILGIYVWPNWFIAQTYKEEIDWMKGWLENRLTWMDAEIGRQFAAPPPSFDRQSGHFDQSLTLKMTAPYGQVYYTTNGSDPRLPGAIHYTTPVTLSSTTLVKARILNRTTWSALSEAVYAGGPVAESLRMSEIMYHPLETGDPNDPNEEFIELRNIGPAPINLNLVRFTNGVDFTFPAIELARAGEPGDHVVVVKDISAFTAGHPGFSGVIAGEYAGSLDNGGERIELQDALGQTIHNFAYKDGWRDISDGQGFSLTIIDPTGAASSTMPDDGLVAYWRLDDGAGATAMDSAGINNGTVHGNPVWTAGRIGGALSLDGAGDYVSLSPVGALAGNNATVSMWINMSELGSAWNPILTQSNLSGDGYYLYTWAGEPTFSVVSGGAGASASSSESVHWNEWHQLAGTNDGSNLRLYVDGVLKGSGSSAGKTGVSDSAYIGYASSTYYYGVLDDVRVYNRALSEYEFAGGGDPLERWGQKDSWRASAYVGGSPGWDDSGIIPNPGAIVINELLAHSHDVAPDWIELYNTTDEDIDVGGWYLSDTEINPKKYKFADGTKIRAYDYLVLHEDANFGEASTDPGRLTGFGFSENGDNVYLRSAEAGILTGYREAESFGASYTGVSFGRYFKRSTGSYNFVPMDYNTPGWANAYPDVGPIVINEIMYNPDWPAGGNYTNDRYEYIELRNITAEPVTLYRFDKALPWKFTEGIEFVFPAWPSAVTIPAGDHIVVVKDPNVFTWRYPAVPAGKIFGPYTGQLANEGEQVELSMPGDIDKFGRQHYIRIDRVGYSDGSHPGDEPGDVDLWPVEADGGGKSLARKVPSLYGNDPNNWQASIPTPAVVNP